MVLALTLTFTGIEQVFQYATASPGLSSDRARRAKGRRPGAELNGGAFRLDVDGDLFKAVVSFPQEV